MCGIGGIIKITPAGDAAKAALAIPPREVGAIPEAWLDILDESIRHRGPDGQGRFRDRVVRADGSVVDVALVHRRLAIIDPATGHQPMVSVPGDGGQELGAGRGASARGAMTPLLFHGKPNAPAVYEAVRAMGMLPMDAEGHGQDARATGDAHGQDARATGGTDLVAVVFNGCIYNHRELRRELLAAGHEFKTDHSDTEVLLHGWREWGHELFSRTDGMFAVLLWDRLTGSLAIARDRCGEKPLYTFHAQRGDSWINVLASTPVDATRLSSLIGASEKSFEQGTGLREWIRFGCGPDPPTPQARSIQPATGVIYGPTRRARWSRVVERGAQPDPGVWSLGAPTSLDPKRGINRITNLTPLRAEELLQRAVASRLEADVPLGCFLSGGVDSSLLALFARRAVGTLRTFTVRVPEAGLDESGFAAEAARIAGTEHVTLDCATTPAADVVSLIRQMGLPFGDSSLLPSAWVARTTRRHVGVALSGDGGDELFAGYERYLWANTTRAWLPGIGVAGRAMEWRARPGSRRAKAARLFRAAASDGYFDLLSIFPSWHLQRLLEGTSTGPLDSASRGFPRINSTALAMECDLHGYLPDDLLRKTDAASMASALEVRCPFLEPGLTHACTHATLESLMPRGQRKGLLRQVARKYFPAEIVDRPKQGFAIPIGEWFRSDYGGMKQLLMDHMESAEPWGPPRLGIDLNMKFVRQMVDEHMNERRDHSQRLYMLLVLSIWAKWMGGL